MAGGRGIKQRGLVRRTFGHAFGYARGAPRWLQVIALVLLVAGTAAGGYYAVNRRAKTLADRAAGEGLKRFNEAARLGDKDKMTAALDDVLAAKPGDANTAARRAALATGTAAPGDKDMARLTLMQALKANDLAAVAREADTLLAAEPKHWLARCAKARVALAGGDAAAAAAELDKLPDPAAGVDVLTGLGMAFEVFRLVGRDAAPLREYVQANVTRFVRMDAVKSGNAGTRLMLAELYLRGFEPAGRPQPPSLLEAYAAARNLAATAALDAAAEPDPAATLARVGRLGPSFMDATDVFRAADQVTADQAKDFKAEDLDRTKKAWEAVLAADPKAAEAHAGLAVGLARGGDYLAARAAVIRGLQACGENPQLADLLRRFLQNEGRSLEAFELFRQTARRNPTDPAWWRLAAEAAVAADRRDLGLAACQEYRAARPDDPWAVRTEARLLLESGDAAAAAQRLFKLGTANLADDPAALRLYVRTLTEAGLGVQLAPVFDAAAAAGQARETAAPVVAAIQGILDAPPDAARAADAAARVAAAQVRFPTDAGLLRLDAEARFRLAELDGWKPAPAAAAVRAAERFRASAPADRANAARLATLRLYAQDNPAQALRDAGPLADAETDPTLTPREAELLGHAYRRAGRPADAVRVLARAAAAYNATAGCLTQLALAHHAAGRADDARAALARAQAQPRTPREQADYAAAAAAIHREKPSP